MAEQIEQAARTAGRTFNISLAELAGANAGQRNDLLALNQAVYRVPDGTLYTSDGSQLVPAQGLPVMANTNPLTGGIEFLLPDGSKFNPAATRQSDGYHFHGFAPNQCNSDLKFLDLSSSLRDGVFQAHLTAAIAWANSGFLSQVNPVTSSELSLVQIPALSFDWLNGDNLLMFWRGKATPEASDQPLMGDTWGASSGNGLRVVSTSAGKLKINTYQQSGSVSRFGIATSATVFEAAVEHSFVVALDGATGKHCVWVDGVRDAAFASGFINLSGGTGAINTLNAAALNLGGDGSTGSGIQSGLACQHRALAILKGRRTSGMPATVVLDAMAAALHRNPSKLITAEAW